MDTFFENLRSLSWWVSVVLIGILLNLLSAYLKSPIDRGIGGFSDYWRTRTNIQKEKRSEYIAHLAANSHEQILLGFRALQLEIRGFMFMVIGTVAGFVVSYLNGYYTGYERAAGRNPALSFPIVIGILLLIGAAILMFMGVGNLVTSRNLNSLIDEARDTENSPKVDAEMSENEE